MKINKTCILYGHNDCSWNEAERKGYYICLRCGKKNPKKTIGPIVSDIWEILKYILLFSSPIIITIGLVIYTDYLRCVQFSQQNNLQFVYKFWAGCMIHYQNHWLSPDQLVQLFK